MALLKVNPDGIRIRDIGYLVDIFDSSGGDIESWTGRIGSGKTYGATIRVVRDLLAGRVVYVNWHIDISSLRGDERRSLGSVLAHILAFKSTFLNIDYQKNLHYYDLDDSKTWYIDYGHDRRYFATVVDFISNITDAVVYADEGQDIFDSYEGTRMSKEARKSLTRTRHYNRTLVIISQRPQAIAVTARANVSVFHRHVKAFSGFGVTLFKVYSTEDIDGNNMPIFTVADQKGRQKMQARVSDWYFARKRIFAMYNSKYLRSGVKKSQEVQFEAYKIGFFSRIILFFYILFGGATRRGREEHNEAAAPREVA